MSKYECWSLISQYLITATAIVGATLAYWQLRKLATAATLQSDQFVLQHQTMISEAFLKLQEASVYIDDLASRKDNGDDTVTVKDIKAANSRLNAAISFYLNALDGLCGTLLRDAKLESRYKIDYRDEIFQTVTRYEDKFGNADKRYRNVLKIHERWKES